MAANDVTIEQAMTWHSAGELERAESAYRQLLTTQPDHSCAMQYLGWLCSQTGRHDEAIALMERARELNSELPHYHANIAMAYRYAGRPADAIAAFQRSIELRPDSVMTHVNFGNLHWELERLDDALKCYSTASALQPNCAEAHHGRGMVLKDVGLLDEALSAFEQALALRPDLVATQSARLYLLNYLPGWPPERIFAEHRRWAEQHADPLFDFTSVHTNDRNADRRLRIGYVSANFCDHAVNYFVEPILSAHDRAGFGVYCYSDVRTPDGTTRQLQSFADTWRNIAGLTDEACAQRIRDDRIDILVDLNGHMGAHRLLAFARKPSPIQVTYVGYQASTGMKTMDYRLTDEFADPSSGTAALHTESLVRLPGLFFCYRPSPSEDRDADRIHENGVVFASFNAFPKINTNVLAAWSQILMQVPGSCLKLLSPQTESIRSRVEQEFTRHGVDPRRIEFVPRLRRPEYLARYRTVDISLDPFPFNGHTTVCDSLWMGVPVVMLAGRSYVQRFGGSALACLGLEELIAHNVADYLTKAVALAQNPPRLRQLHQTLRTQFESSAICDEVGFTRRLEAAYRRMWRDWLERSS